MPVETSDATSGDNRMPDGDSPFQHELIEELIENYEIASTYEKRNFKLAREDLDIISGKTWSEDDEAQRKLDGRPCLKFPILNQYTDQVIGDWRQNRVDIVVSPAAGHKQNKAYVDEDGNEVPTHEGRAGMIRAIAKSGGADIARDTAFEHAVSCGFGHYRLITEYNGSGFDQDIRYRKINDQFSVHWDPGAEEYDRRDAEWAIVMVSMPKKSFERKYPGMAVHDNLPMEADQYDGLKEWFTEDEVRIAEYFRKEPVKKMMYLLPDGRVLRDDEKNYQSVLDELTAQGLAPVKQREIEDHDVIYMQSTGVEIIDGPRKWPGRFIPIISVWGKEHPEGDGKVTYRSLIRYAHDAQKMFDYMRPLALDTRLPTPKGWTTMGDVRPGDTLLDDQGRPTRVVGMSPVHLHKDCYRVTFSDGTSIVADADHPWPCESRGKRLAAGTQWRNELVETKDLIPGKHFIPVTAPLDLKEARLPIDPYLLGAWLGDGRSESGRICQDDRDMDALREGISDECSEVRKSGWRVGEFTVKDLTTRLRKLKLLGNKHIPQIYLRASKEQRLALLQGLMDTDGTVHHKLRSCGFVTTIPALADGFAELLRSLGIKVRRKTMPGRRSKLVGYDCDVRDYEHFSFTCYEPAFRFERKRELQMAPRKRNERRTKRHVIESVERVDSVPVKCVAIDAPSHLFLAGEGMIPTHNTAAIERAALEPKVPYTIGKSQIGDYEEYWATANTTNHAYLPYDDEVNPASPQRTFPPQVAQAYFHESEQARNDVKASIGMYDAAVGGRSNETSGKAIIARQRESDIMSFPFIDNMGRSVQYEYEVVNDLIPHIYDTRRAARMLNSDDTEVRMTLFDTVTDKETGNTVTINDISQDKFDISVSVGPSYTTQRQETAEAMMEFISKVDGAGQLTGDLVAKALDFVGKEDFAKRLRYLLPPEVREAEDMETAGEEPVPMHIKAQLDQMAEMNTMLEQAVQELQPQLQEKDAQLQKSQASEATAKAQQQMDKQAADIELQRKQVDYDKRLLKLEQRIDDRAAQDKAEREQMAQTVHEQGAAQQSEVLANFTTVAQELVGTIQAQGEAMMAASASIQQGAEQMASSAELIARYFAANRSMDVDEEGRPTKVTVEGFGGVTINGPSGNAEPEQARSQE